MTVFIIALSITSLAVIAVISFRGRTLRRQQGAMADAELAAVYGRYQKDVREFTESYMLHAPPDHQWLAEIEDAARVWDEPGTSRPMAVRRRPSWYTLRTVPALIMIDAAIFGLLIGAMSHRGVWEWWGLIIPTWGLLGILTQYTWRPPHWPTLLTGRRPVQVTIGSAVVGLVVAATLSGGAWWALLVPACGLILILILYPRHFSEQSDQPDISAKNNLVPSSQ